MRKQRGLLLEGVMMYCLLNYLGISVTQLLDDEELNFLLASPASLKETACTS